MEPLFEHLRAVWVGLCAYMCVTTCCFCWWTVLNCFTWLVLTCFQQYLLTFVQYLLTDSWYWPNLSWLASIIDLYWLWLHHDHTSHDHTSARSLCCRSAHLIPTSAWNLTLRLLLITWSAGQLLTQPAQPWTSPELLHYFYLPTCNFTYYVFACSPFCWSCVWPLKMLTGLQLFILQWEFKHHKLDPWLPFVGTSRPVKHSCHSMPSCYLTCIRAQGWRYKRAHSHLTRLSRQIHDMQFAHWLCAGSRSEWSCSSKWDCAI